MVIEFNISTSFFLRGMVEMEQLRYLYGALSFVTYLFTLLCNLMVVIVVLKEKSLHQPMYSLITSLVLDGWFSSSSFLPKLIVDLFSSSVVVSREECYIQSFCLLFAYSCEVSTFTIMAYDTHLAVCHPLRYNSLITNTVAVNLIAGSHFFNLILVLIVILLSARLPLCGFQINGIFCDNLSLYILSCVDSSINKVFGSVVFLMYLISALLVITYSYIRIFLICLRVSKDAGKKAIHTVVTHLLNFCIFLTGLLFVFIRYRLENGNLPLFIHILLSVAALVFPPLLTPLIYGIRTKALRTKLLVHLHKINKWRHPLT
ncbi:hypothetical protein GDO86_018508 [Hymenochirus boettgeri]|uniref:G-protein coupled receptors family 1 profile domain-containing protein n=1 Tax=Hymenochirus boettgeri TaxID=247094 RepID=A0A8T2IAH6_9PIPI|nr:hypothetical protein GDO86_018508 [Hymenochirus boettgeri]